VFHNSAFEVNNAYSMSPYWNALSEIHDLIHCLPFDIECTLFSVSECPSRTPIALAGLCLMFSHNATLPPDRLR
jgi:hypothetical protein